MEINIIKDKATLVADENQNSGAINEYIITPTFSEDWNGLTKVAIFLDRGNVAIPVTLQDGVYTVPKLGHGKYFIGFVGYSVVDGIKTKQISTNLIPKLYLKGAGDDSITLEEQEVPTTTVWEQYIATMNNVLEQGINARDITTQAKNDTVQLKTDVEGLKTGVEQDIATGISTIDGMLEDYNNNASAKTEAFNTNFDEKKNEIDVTAEEVETARQEVATNTAIVESDKTQVAEDKASVNSTYADFLAQIGSEIATLGQDGKIPMSQIPATATQEIYEVSSENELVNLTAQKGDLAELVEEIDGERTVTKTWQLLGIDSTVRTNWVTWGTSYAVSAGNASNATNAEDSTKINGKRIISMTKEAYDNAYSSGTLLEDTFYFVEE